MLAVSTWHLLREVQYVEVPIHSWFTNVVDGNELDPVYPIQLKQLNYEDPEDDWAKGATMAVITDLGINIHIPLQNFSRMCAARWFLST